MPEGWRKPTNNNNNNNILPENRRLSVTIPVQITNWDQTQGSRSKKTTEKAHLDTLRRRERRQRSRVTLLEQSEEFGCLNDNRFILLSGTDDDSEVDDLDDNNHRRHKP